MKILGIIAAIFALGVLALALNAFTVWLGVEVIANHDINFNEAVGYGLLLGAAGGSQVALNRA